jgi:hypothetical protein
VDVHLSESVGALSALSVVPGGYGGRQGLPSVLLGGTLNGKLVAYPWPIDARACQAALDLGEQGSVEPAKNEEEESNSESAQAGGLGVHRSSIFDNPNKPPPSISLSNPLMVSTHSGAVSSMGISPEGDVIVTAGRDGSLFITMLRRSGTGNAVKLSGEIKTLFEK